MKRLKASSPVAATKREGGEETDVEALLPENTDSNPSSSSSTPTFANPILKLVRFAIVKDKDGPPETILDFLKDSVIGVFFGVLAVCLLIFLDHRNVIHLQSAHNFRDTAFKLLSDPETLANLEESTDMKFVMSDSYNAMNSELLAAESKLAKAREKLDAQIKEIEVTNAELAPLKEEYEKLMAESNLELDKFCPTCSWNGGINCQARFQYMIDTYNMAPLSAKVNVMGAPSCKGS